ncbi:MAG: serine/threonine-protein kinase, partial [Planctomycetota bacterium]
MPTPNVRKIFDAAYEIDEASERESYLSEACGANTVLRMRVEALLAESGRDTGLLGGPAVAAVDESAATIDTDTDGASPPPAATTELVDTAAVTEGPGSVIGPYKLLQELGEGGFGVVYMAEQEKPIRRRVALKVIKAGMDTKAVIARFEAERQALALMEHRNIARVLDAGATSTGRPFFVMELVKGVPITDYCDQAELSTRERLELFVELCRAIQHAHQKGIIHRDLKPSNVLVTLREDQPVVKVIDFGIAKATAQKLTEKTLFTAYGQMIGTPVYMSPEQAGMSEIDVDTRSDVYSLGVLLYELLTGATPIDPKSLRGAAFDEMQRLIREETPSKPSTRLSTLADDLRRSIAASRRSNPEELRKACDGDLDWIVMKSLEKERSRRYESASAFAQDVERHLNSEPVSAMAPSASYRLKKFVERNRTAVTVAAAIAALLVVATTVSSYL